MDGDGREQVSGHVPSNDEDENAITQGNAPIRPEGRGEDRHGGGAFNTDRSDKAVSIQSIVDEDKYAGSAESGV